jgi:hypothetical protein
VATENALSYPVPAATEEIDEPVSMLLLHV